MCVCVYRSYVTLSIHVCGGALINGQRVASQDLVVQRISVLSVALGLRPFAERPRPSGAHETSLDAVELAVSGNGSARI